MAKLEKTRARKPLAEGQFAAISWGSAFSGLADEGIYRVSINADEHSYRMGATAKEWYGFIGFIAGRETFDPVPSYAQDTRTLPEKLRALADKLEAKGNMQRITLTD